MSPRRTYAAAASSAHRSVEFEKPRRQPATKTTPVKKVASASARRGKTPEVHRISDSLKTLSVTDIDARLNVLQSYFDSLRDQ